MNELQQIIEFMVRASAFGLVLCLWIGGIVLWLTFRGARKARIGRRLGIARDGGEDGRVLDLWHGGHRTTTTVPGEPVSAPRPGRHGRAGSGPVLFACIAIALLIAAATFVIAQNLVLSVGFAIATLVIVRLLVGHRVTRQRDMFDRQLVDALELAGRSLRAGHPLTGAFQLVSEEMPQPVSRVFGEICQQHAMGGQLEDVLRIAADRSGSADMRLLATSVAIQARAGGNMATLMDRLAVVIRERMRLSRRVRVLTAQTQLSKRVLIVLPVLVFFLFTVLNADYMAPFYTTLVGKLMLGSAVLLLAFGTWVMHRMTLSRA